MLMLDFINEDHTIDNGIILNLTDAQFTANLHLNKKYKEAHSLGKEYCSTASALGRGLLGTAYVIPVDYNIVYIV